MLLKSIFVIIFMTISMSFSQRCPDMCMTLYRPVCGIATSLRIQCTFSNSCGLGVRSCQRPREGWRLFHEGICRFNSAECRELLII
ncbi:Vasotab [Lucilia cuprina]|nr:Vasotab [Lucilia cuprina]